MPFLLTLSHIFPYQPPIPFFQNIPTLISYILKICFVTIHKILTTDAGEDERRKAAVFTAGGNVSADIRGITVRIPQNPQ